MSLVRTLWKSLNSIGVRLNLVENTLGTVNQSLSGLTQSLTGISTTVNSVSSQAQASLKKAELVTFTLASTAATAIPITGFTSVKAIIPIPVWVNNQMYIPGVASGFTNTSMTVTGKRTKGTLLLSDGPMEGSAGTFSVIVVGI